MMPRQREMEVPLLMCLHEMGGKAEPREIYSRIGKFFPQLSDSDLAETLPSGGNKWTNRVQWVRQRLVSLGEMASPEHGIWAITDLGRRRLGQTARSGPVTQPTAVAAAKESEEIAEAMTNLEELVEDYIDAFKQKLVQRLLDLDPNEFERFAAQLLIAYGFERIQVTGRPGDKGIDGFGRLRVGLAAMNVAFQCKRWQGPVSGPEINGFRGAIQGEFEQGIFFTTSDFTSQARELSIKKGAVPIVLVNGDAIAQLMIDKQLGVKRRTVEVFEDQIESLFEERPAH